MTRNESQVESTVNVNNPIDKKDLTVSLIEPMYTVENDQNC